MILEEDVDVEPEELDMQSVEYYCEATVVELNSPGQQPVKVWAMLESGFGLSCLPEKLAAELGAHFVGTRIVDRRATRLGLLMDVN